MPQLGPSSWGAFGSYTPDTMQRSADIGAQRGYQSPRGFRRVGSAYCTAAAPEMQEGVEYRGIDMKVFIPAYSIMVDSQCWQADKMTEQEKVPRVATVRE